MWDPGPRLHSNFGISKGLRENHGGTEQTLIDKVLELLPVQVRLRISEIDPESLDEVAEIIRFYEREGLETSSQATPRDAPRKSKGSVMEINQTPVQSEVKYILATQAPYNNTGAQTGDNMRRAVQRKPLSEVECYSCHRYGHIARNCPNAPQSSRPPQYSGHPRFFQPQQQQPQNY